MIRLFLLPPANKGRSHWIKHGIVGCYCSNPKRGPFYVSSVHSSENDLGKTLWLLGGALANFAVRHNGMIGAYAATRFLSRFELSSTDGDSPIGDGIAVATKLRRGFKIAIVAGAGDIRRSTTTGELSVGIDYKCDPEVFAQQAVFLQGFWESVA